MEENEYENDNILPSEYYSGPILWKLRSQLSIYHKMHLDLKKVNNGYKKKMRFTIIALCPSCNAANHVDMDFFDDESKKCEVCSESQEVFATMTEIFSIHAPIGTQHGSRIRIPDEGSFGPDGIRGDIIVTFLDEPHEHFLRVEHDIMVCFKIDHEESVNGVARILRIVVPRTQDILLVSENGDKIRDNDVRYVAGMGLPYCETDNRRGRLIIVFFVKSRKSMCPVKLKTVKIDTERYRNNTNEVGKSNGSSSSPWRNCNAVEPCCSTSNGIKRNTPRTYSNSRKRRSDHFQKTNGSDNGISSDRENNNSLHSEDSASSSSRDPRTSSSSPLYSPDGIKKKRKINHKLCVEDRLTVTDLEEFHPENVNLSSVTFLDRLIVTGALPMPYWTEVKEQIPFAELELLRQRRFYNSWWQRICKGVAVPDDIDNVLHERFPPPEEEHTQKASKSLHNIPMFTVREDDCDEDNEALHIVTSRNSCFIPDIPKFTLKKLSRDGKRKILLRIKKALTRNEV